MLAERAVPLAFGRANLTVTFPSDANLTVVRKAARPKLSDPVRAVYDAPAAPIGSRPLSELAHGRNTACILVCDIMRPVPNHLFLRPMIETLVGSGIPLDRITVLIATGLVEPHFMAGYSGGRKVVAPGVAHAEVIRTFHSSRFMEDPRAVSCNLDGNPLHEEQLEIVRRIGEIVAFNTAIDEDRDLVFASFGEIIASHAAAVGYVESWAAVRLPQRYSTVVTSAAGYPLDKTYYQTVKGMVVPVDIVAPGGTLIVASACSEGFRSPDFREAQRRLVELGPDAFLASIATKRFADIDEWQTEMQLKAMRVGRVQLYTTGLDPEERRLTGVETIASVDAAVRESIARSGDSAVAVIPEGPYVVPTTA